jgi:23S rRNA pseudouridine1911/1915/1917 synthase
MVPEDDALTSDDAPEALLEDEERSFQLGALEHGMRLDRVLAARVPEFSRNHMQTLIEGGHVMLDGQAQLQPSRKVRVGQKLLVRLVPTSESLAFRPEAMEIAMVHEDESVWVIDKAAGRVVHPAPGHWSGTLLNGLLARDARSAQLPRAGIVHRLDKDTSGLMVVARSLEAMTSLVRDLSAHEVRRRYAALVWGVPTVDQFTIASPVGRDPVSRVKMAVISSGKPARTDVEVVASRGGISAIRCQLHTGRTHQIRVHLSSIGLPLVSDAVYGGKPGLDMQRQALHAFELGFVHPATRVSMRFHASLPADFAHAWNWVSGSLP